MSVAHQNTDQSVQASVQALFQAYTGRDKPMSYGELARLCDLASGQVYDYGNGKYLGSAVALIRLCQQVPEAAVALASMIEHDAQQGHGCEFAIMSDLASANAQVTTEVTAVKGKLTQRTKAVVINVIRRVVSKGRLYLAHHAGRAPA